MRYASTLLALALCIPTAARAEIKAETLEYKEGDTVLEGHLVYDDKIQGKRPAVLVVHEWWGLNDYAKSRARQLAEMGYVALAVDIYGKGVRAETQEEASALATKFRGDRPLLRARINAGLEAVKANSNVDPTKIAAIGYCFGGTTTLELARSGADVKGVVSFHGGLKTPTPDDAKNIKARVLVFHGNDDPFVPPAEVGAFIEEMKAGNVNYQITGYGGAVHTFTNPAAGNDPSKGQAYNEQADKRSWREMKAFLDEIFGKAN